MASRSTIILEAEFGPTLRTALDVLDLARDLADFIPEWHAAERDELVARMEALAEVATERLRAAAPR